MPTDPLHELPPSVELDLSEAGELLGVLDEALEISAGELRTRIDLAKAPADPEALAGPRRSPGRR